MKNILKLIIILLVLVGCTKENPEILEPYFFDGETDPCISTSVLQYNGIENSCFKNIHFNDFSTDNGDWATANEPEYTFEIKNGTYRLKSAQNEFWVTTKEFPEIQDNIDFQIDIEAQMSGSLAARAIICWGSTRTPNFDPKYTFEMDGDEFEIYDDIASQNRDFWKTGSGYNFFNKTLISIRKFKEEYYFFINENLVATHSFKPFYGNYFRMGGANGTTLIIDSIRIREISEQ